MVKPKIIVISAAEAGQDSILLPEFAGYDLMVTRRGIGDLTATEVAILPSGGFRLAAPDVLAEGEVFTVSPLPREVQYPVSPVFPATRYPHKLFVTTSTDSSQDGDGNWSQGVATTVEFPCRAEPNISVRDGLSPAPDGRVLSYGWTLYMPMGGPSLRVGSTVVVKNGDMEEIARETVKRFSRGQLNTRAWL